MSVVVSTATRKEIANEPFGVDLQLAVVDTGSALTAQSGDTSGNANVSLGTSIAGERNTSSTTEDYLSTRMPVKPVILTGTSAVTIGGSTTANDIHLAGLVILKNAGPATVTLTAGFNDQDNSAVATVAFTGSTTADTFIDFGSKSWLNTKAALQITPSVTQTVIVLYRNAS